MGDYFRVNAAQVRPVWRSDGSGLRRAQVGAAFALTGHLASSTRPGQVAMPTGTGKTAVISLTPFLIPTERLLVIAPGTLVRDQIVEELRSLATLRATDSVIGDMAGPTVHAAKHRITTVAQWEDLARFDAVVGTPMCLSGAIEGVAPPPADLFDLAVFDEAHHTPARTWEAILDQFPTARAGLFTATPYRRDLRALPGQLCFSYSLHDAITDGVYEPVQFRAVVVPPGGDRDRALASAARDRLADPAHVAAGSQLLVRAGRIAGARSLVEVYRQLGVTIEVIDSQHSLTHVRRVVARLRAGELQGVATVGLLGEGFDLPTLKIAAYHDRHRSLPATLQFIGRVARTHASGGPAELLAVRQDVEDETRALYQEDASWSELLPALADTAIADERDRRIYLQGFDPPPPDSFSLHALAPARESEVFELSHDAIDLTVDIDTLAGAEVWWSSTDDIGDLRALVTRRRDRPSWMRTGTLDGISYDLHLVVHDRTRRLLFISSPTPATRRDLLTAIGAPPVRPVAPESLNRLLYSVSLMSYSSVGLRSARGSGVRQPSYKTVAGSSVQQAVLPTEAMAFGVGHLIGRYRDDSGHIEAIGVSIAKGKVWTPGASTLLGFRRWCSWAGDLLNATVQTGRGAPLLDVPMPRRLATYPPNPVAVVLHHKAIDGSLVVKVEPDQTVDLLALRVEPELINNQECLLRFSYDGTELGRLRVTVPGTCEAIGSDIEIIDRATGEVMNLADVLADFPPMIYFADGSGAVGATVYVARSDLPPLGPGIAESIDWTGVDIRAEARVKDATLLTVQQRTITWIASSAPDVVIVKDDGSGEMADLIVIDATDDEHAKVSLLHCKYSSEDLPGLRVADLYEVVGQAIRSAQWTAVGTIWPELLRRLESRTVTSVVQGDTDRLHRLLEVWTTRPPAVDCTIAIVQPGLRVGDLASSNNCQTLLVATQGWIEGHAASLRVIGS